MTNVREATNNLVALHTKALVWMRRHALEGNRVKIQQLASSLRVGVAQAEEIVGFHMLRNQSDSRAIAIQYLIFVVDNKIPDWMRRYLSAASITAILIEARKTTNTVLHRDLHRKVLTQTYGNTLKGLITEEYRDAEQVVVAVLNSVGLEEATLSGEYPQLDQLDNPFWYELPLGGSASVHQYLNYANGTDVRLHFGAISYTDLDNLEYNNIPQLTPKNNNKCTLLPKQIDECIIKTQCIIALMQTRGFGLQRVSSMYHTTPKGGRTYLVFAKNNDLGTTVSITLPWDHLILKAA